MKKLFLFAAVATTISACCGCKTAQRKVTFAFNFQHLESCMKHHVDTAEADCKINGLDDVIRENLFERTTAAKRSCGLRTATERQLPDNQKRISDGIKDYLTTIGDALQAKKGYPYRIGKVMKMPSSAKWEAALLIDTGIPDADEGSELEEMLNDSNGDQYAMFFIVVFSSAVVIFI